MRELYEKLVKILHLEQSKEFDDSAVIGGLEGFLAFWLTEARAKAATVTDRKKVEEVADRLYGYINMEPEKRAAQIRYLTERLGFGSASTTADKAPRANGEAKTEERAPEVQARAGTHAGTGTTRRDEVPRANRIGSETATSGTPPLERESTDVSSARPERGTASVRQSTATRDALRSDQELDRPVTDIPGVGTAKANRLKRLGIHSIRDLLYHAPFRYEDYTTMKQIVELVYGDEVTIAGVIQDIDAYKTQRGVIVITALVSDGTGTLQAKWFGNRHLINQLRPGTMVRLSGKVDAYLGRLQLTSPRYEIIVAEEVREGRLVPIYPRTDGVSEKALTRDIAAALKLAAGKIVDPLPEEVRKRWEVLPLPRALERLHHPKNQEQAKAARQRLAFDELLRLQLGMLQQRQQWHSQQGPKISYDQGVLHRFFESLPFQLTKAQQRALDEILADLGKEGVMNRLLQGDVGSGKTVVAAAALLAAVSAGYQGALVAPTEILAEQHFHGLSKLLEVDPPLLSRERPLTLALLTGSMTVAEKADTRERIARSEVDVVVGTHALLQESVEFAKLGLAIVDEQHRFGVQQRSALRERTPETTPHLLVMSATPIPRSLALTLYGDLDLSTIDELPPGRQPIVTRVITPYQRERAYTYIRRQVLEGRQAFIICPLVEESDKLEARSAVEEHRFLQQEVFPDFTVGLLHGRMRPEEKDAEMTRFYRNESQILVSTAVVEVGIDVPNATVMLIEGANRFGLAQLHQFRGRIGRGPWRSLCLLMAEEGLSSEGEQRLQALVDNADGFALAEEDLRMRGPGDFFGTRQSGLPELQMARLGDTVTLSRAREAAHWILERDPELAHPEHQLLAEHTRRYWRNRGGDLS